MFFGVDVLHFLKEGGHIEVDLRQIHQVGAVAGQGSQGGGAGEPAGVAAHALDDGDHALVVNVAVTVHFGHGGGDVLGGGGEAGAMVGAGQVVVDGLRDAHAAHFVAVLQHELADLVAGVHGVVAAVVEEIADVVLPEHLQDLLIIGIVFVGIGDLVAAGAQRGGGRVLHLRKLGGVFLAQVEQIIVQQAHDAVLHAVDLGDDVAVQRGLDRAVRGSVDNGGRSAALAYDRSTLQS